jgi:hypothetical protein
LVIEVLSLVLQTLTMNYLKKIPALVIFSLVVFSLLFSSFTHEAAPQKKIKENSDKKTEKQNPDKEIISPLAIEAVIPFTQPDLNLDLYFISERKFSAFTRNFVSVKAPQHINAYFKNLFTYVICVNAP